MLLVKYNILPHAPSPVTIGQTRSVVKQFTILLQLIKVC